ncbi:MAG: SRPBCC domain-containing protein [Planctomycetes bacterium]|nr:SRPBCC domain-containing protein [Planctomycetota bacterium]
MPIPLQTVRNVVTTVIGLSYEIQAPRAAVWRAITEQTAEWWPEAMLVGGPGTKLTFEARLGGRLFEQWGQGSGLIWYEVIAIDPQSTIDLTGHVTQRFGGPAVSQLHIALTDEAGGTRVSLTDAVIGVDRSASNRQVTEGWSLVFGKALKKYLEQR